MEKSVWKRLQQNLQANSAYLPIERQRRLLKRMIWGAVGISAIGAAGTFLAPSEPVVGALLMSTSVVVQLGAIAALFLLQRGMLNAATGVICAAIYYGAFCTITPYGLDANSMAIIGFLIPMVILVLMWGRFGVIVALTITTVCYVLLAVSQRQGLIGWAPRLFEPFVSGAIELAVLWFAGILMLRSQREIAELSIARKQANEHLKAAQGELAASQRQLEEFTARIVHDLSAPIQVLHAALYHHRDPVAHDQIELLDHYVGQLRAYLSVRSATIARRPVDLLPICLAAIDAAQVYADRRGVAVSLDLVAPTTTVLGDATAIRRVLDNLLTNAVNVTPEGGEVLVAVRPDPSGLELAVSDAGPGVADPVAIFEPYMSRAVGQRRTGTSLGLGLAIVRELTGAMGGQSAVRSAPGQGSTFSIMLPRSEEYAHHSRY